MIEKTSIIDKTDMFFSKTFDYQDLFIQLLKSNSFSNFKIANVKVTPESYLKALTMDICAQNPARIVIGDYSIRLHC